MIDAIILYIPSDEDFKQATNASIQHPCKQLKILAPVLIPVVFTQHFI
jgi:hypothetical protein